MGRPKAEEIKNVRPGKTTGYVIVNDNGTYYMVAKIKPRVYTKQGVYNIFEYDSVEKKLRFIRQVTCFRNRRTDAFLIGYALCNRRIVPHFNEVTIKQLEKEINDGENHIEV